MSLTPEEQIIDLQALAGPLLDEVFTFVSGETKDKAPLAAELSRRMAIYAARGDREGMNLVIGRAAAAVQDSKLEAEATFERILTLAGNLLLDVAEKLLPRVIGAFGSNLSNLLEGP